MDKGEYGKIRQICHSLRTAKDTQSRAEILQALPGLLPSDPAEYHLPAELEGLPVSHAGRVAATRGVSNSQLALQEVMRTLTDCATGEDTALHAPALKAMRALFEKDRFADRTRVMAASTVHHVVSDGVSGIPRHVDSPERIIASADVLTACGKADEETGRSAILTIHNTQKKIAKATEGLGESGSRLSHFTDFPPGRQADVKEALQNSLLHIAEAHPNLASEALSADAHLAFLKKMLQKTPTSAVTQALERGAGTLHL